MVQRDTTFKCAEKENEAFPLYCKSAVERKCQVVLPCVNHVNGIEGYIEHGQNILKKTIGEKDNKKIIITIPCDSTDAWIVAAYEDIDNVEEIEDPWKNIIAKGKYYHDIRVRGEKKSLVTYEILTEHMVKNWDAVTRKCISAKYLEKEIQRCF